MLEQLVLHVKLDIPYQELSALLTADMAIILSSRLVLVSLDFLSKLSCASPALPAVQLALAGPHALLVIQEFLILTGTVFQDVLSMSTMIQQLDSV